MSTLAIETGLLLIDRITIRFETDFPANDRPEFSKSRENLIKALRTFEETSDLRNSEEKNEARNQVELCLNALLDFFSNGSPNQIVFDIIFCYLYDQITATLDKFEQLLDIHARKQYLLADLFEIPMDAIHGRLFEYKVTPKSHYTDGILNALLTRTNPNTYSEEAIKKIQQNYKLTTAQATAQLERLHGYFDMTAKRYGFTTNELIRQLLDKKKRNANVHVGKDLTNHYQTQQELFAERNGLVSDNPHVREAAERKFDHLLGVDTRKRIQQGSSDELQPKFLYFLNSPQLKPMRTLFTNNEIDQLEKMFTHYCKSYIEDW